MATKGIPQPEDVPRSSISAPITPGEPKLPERPPTFKTFMEGKEANPLMAAGKPTQVSPFDLAHGRVAAPGPTFSTIQEQAKTAQSILGDVTNQLQTPKLKLKQSSKYLLKNKLSSAKEHIRSASNKLGAKQTEDTEVPGGAGPIQKYLGLVTDGQKQLQEVQTHLAAIAEKGQDMRPADMLLVQVKLSKAQQEIEYSSLLLSKAVDDLKLMMNIQL